MTDIQSGARVTWNKKSNNGKAVLRDFCATRYMLRDSHHKFRQKMFTAEFGTRDLVLLTQYCAGGKIKKNEMGRACGAYGGGERCAQGVGGEA
jgi:hypothetical protein